MYLNHVYLNLTIGVVCELSDSHHIQHPQDPKTREGWTYRGIAELGITSSVSCG